MCVVSKNSDDEKYMKLRAKIIYFLQNDQSESRRNMARPVSQPLSSSKKSLTRGETFCTHRRPRMKKNSIHRRGSCGELDVVVPN